MPPMGRLSGRERSPLLSLLAAPPVDLCLTSAHSQPEGDPAAGLADLPKGCALEGRRESAWGEAVCWVDSDVPNVEIVPWERRWRAGSV